MFTLTPVTLQLGALRLAPLTEADIETLWALGQTNAQHLQYMSGVEHLQWYRSALDDLQAARALPLVISVDDQAVGITRFAEVMAHLPACEIGWTWLDHRQHGTGVNTQMKYLMLKQAFEGWAVRRVQLKTAASNVRSQRAIEKLGAQYEGRLRHHRRLADGCLDDTMMYSITDLEWPAVHQRLLQRMAEMHNA